MILYNIGKTYFIYENSKYSAIQTVGPISTSRILLSSKLSCSPSTVFNSLLLDRPLRIKA